MDLIIERDRLLKAVARVQSVVENRQTMPILSHVLIDASENGTVSFVATDLEISIRSRAEAVVDVGGSLAVSAKKLFDIVRELPDRPIRLRSDSNDRCLVTCERSRFSILGMRGDEFPDYATPVLPVRLTMETLALAQMITRTHFAMSQDETRFALNGICLEIAPSEEATTQVRMVATDTHRLNLAEATGTLEQPPETVVRYILPRKGVTEIRKLLDTKEKEQRMVTIELCASHASVVHGDAVLTTKLLSGKFPNYMKVIPQNNTLMLTVEREALQGCVRRMSALSSEKAHGIMVRVKDEMLYVNTNNPDSENAEEELTATSSPGMELTIGFNARYLMEVLGAHDNRDVRFRFQDDESPVLIIDPDSDQYKFVLMPMRV
jgi:DNA polymerase-3 subunit beta